MDQARTRAGTMESSMSVGGIVLCGGRSSRMGVPKLSLPFGDEVLLQRVTRIVDSVVAPVVVVAAPGQEIPRLPTFVEVVRDEQEGLGPLAGLAAGLTALRGRVDAAYVTACDVPLLRPEFITAVILRLGPHEIAVPYDGQFRHPLSAVYRTSLATRARDLLAAGHRRLLDLVEQSDTLSIDTVDLQSIDPRLDSLRNLNTPEDYAAALRTLPATDN